MIRPTTAAAAFMATLLLGACAGTGSNVSDSPFSAADGEREIVQIQVLNNNFSDATLWAVVMDSRRIRLGNVTGKTDASFSIPWRFSEPMRIEIDMVAGPRCRTRPITVDPGDVLQLEIQSVFRDTRDCQPI